MKRIGLFVGIDRYKDTGISPLRCAVKDATALMAAFSRAQFDNVDSLLNDDAHCDNILDKAERIMEGLDAGDLFVFYFSGHGREFSNTHYLVGPTARANTELYQRGSLSLPELISITNKCGVNRLFILDCCRSNILAGRAGSFTVDNARDIALNAAIQNNKNKSIIPPLILCSCSTGEQAFEGKEHGYFTETLLASIARQDIKSFQQFQRSLLITGTPAPQNISWNGNITAWENIALFKSWTQNAENMSNSEPSHFSAKKSNHELYILEDLKKEVQESLSELKNGIDNDLQQVLNRAERAKNNSDYSSAVYFLEQAKEMIATRLFKSKKVCTPNISPIVKVQVQNNNPVHQLQIVEKTNEKYIIDGAYYTLWCTVHQALQFSNITILEENFTEGKIVGKQKHLFATLIVYVTFCSSENGIEVKFTLYMTLGGSVNNQHPTGIILRKHFEKLANAPVKNFINNIPHQCINTMPPTCNEHQGVSYAEQAKAMVRLALVCLLCFHIGFIITLIPCGFTRKNMDKSQNYEGIEHLYKALYISIGGLIFWIFTFTIFCS